MSYGGFEACLKSDDAKGLRALFESESGVDSFFGKQRPIPFSKWGYAATLCFEHDAQKCLRELFKAGMPMDLVWKNAGGGSETTLLCDALSRSAGACSLALIKIVDVDRCGAGAISPLMKAAGRLNLSAIEALLPKADVLRTSKEGVSALGWCAGAEGGRNKKIKALRMIIERIESKHGPEVACDAALSALEMTPMGGCIESFGPLWGRASKSKDAELMRDLAIGCAAHGFEAGFEKVWPKVDKSTVGEKLARFGSGNALALAAKGGSFDIFMAVFPFGTALEYRGKGNLGDSKSALAQAVAAGRLDLVRALANHAVSLDDQGAEKVAEVAKNSPKATVREAAKLLEDLALCQRESREISEAMDEASGGKLAARGVRL